MTKPSCRACAHSYMEPDGPARLICGHESAGSMGKYVTNYLNEEIPTLACNTSPFPTTKPNRTFFTQHPGRTASGDLK